MKWQDFTNVYKEWFAGTASKASKAIRSAPMVASLPEGAEIFYHGTDARRLFTQFGSQHTYLSDANTAFEYAAGSQKVGKANGRILAVAARPGQIKFDPEIEKIHLPLFGAQAVRDIERRAAQARTEGFDYLDFNHPTKTFMGETTDSYKVRVALNPDLISIIGKEATGREKAIHAFSIGLRHPLAAAPFGLVSAHLSYKKKHDWKKAALAGGMGYFQARGLQAAGGILYGMHQKDSMILAAKTLAGDTAPAESLFKFDFKFDFSKFMTKAHDPLIEGLRHGGAAEHTRHALTDFGSGWRGLISVEPGIMEGLSGYRKTAALSLGSAHLRRNAKLLSKSLKDFPEPVQAEALRAIEQMTRAASWSDKTGFDAIAINRVVPRSQIRSTIRHERIHGLEKRYPKHPFVRSEIEASPDLATSIRRSIADPAKAESAIRHYRSSELSDTVMNSEKLAWGRETDRMFFTRAKAAGLKMPGTIARAHEPLIEGLSHGTTLTKTGSMAARLRKLLTRFGSGWRGIISLPAHLLPSMGGASIRPEDMAVTMKYMTDTGADKLHPAAWKEIQSAAAWSKKTGFGIVVISDALKGAGVRDLIRHERIHGIHMRNPEHPFFQSVLSKYPTIRDAHLANSMTVLKKEGVSGILSRKIVEQDIVKASLAKDDVFGLATVSMNRKMLEGHLKSGMSLDRMNDMLYDESRTVGDIYASVAAQNALKTDNATASRIVESERIAYGHMQNPGIYREMKAAGLKLPFGVGPKAAPSPIGSMAEAAAKMPPSAEAGVKAEQAAASMSEHITPKNLGIAALVVAGAGIAHHIMKKGNHRHDRTSKQSMNAAACSTCMPSGV